MDIKESGEDTPFEEQEQEDVVDSGDEKITEEVNGDENADSSQSGDEESGALEPIAYWNFDEGAGTSVNDYTGNGNTGRLNIYPWTKGVTGELTDSCVSFNGSNYIEVPKSEDLDITGAFTVTLWIRPDDLRVDNDGDVRQIHRLLYTEAHAHGDCG